MKKFFLGLSAITMLFATSCQKDADLDFNVGETSVVSFNVGTPQLATRAYSDGLTATKLQYAVYDSLGNILPTFTTTDATINGSTTVNLQLTTGHKYSVIFWAAAENAPYTVDLGNKTMTVDYTAATTLSNDEERDAFYKHHTFTVRGPQTETIELKRPFAQLNIGTNDYAQAAATGYAPINSSVTVTNGVYSTLNMATGGVTDKVPVVKFDYNTIPTAEKFPVDGGYKYIAMNYLLVDTTKDVIEIEFGHSINDATAAKTRKVGSVPVRRNYRTNIYGSLLTSNVTVEVDIEPDYKDKFDNEGYFIETNANGTSTAVVESANGLATIAQEIENGNLPSNIDIVLDSDVDLSQLAALIRSEVVSNWNPIGTEEEPFTGTFDGKGYTIKNLNIVEQEAKESKAFIGFFGYAKNATIKNVTFENVYINIPCLDIDHSQGHIGAVAGSLEGTSTIENVTVKGDIKVYATQNANGASRVAVVAGGNSDGNVTMKNVHVIANEGSYLIANNNTGALAGQLQGKSVFENCSSNIDVTVNKFFAGGIIGLAAGDQLFKNCHTTGNVAVVAGREGRAHDQYRVGGIAGGWADGAKNVCTLENCSYTGKVSGKNSDGSVAEPLDYLGYVGRGYGLNGCKGSKVVINGISFVQVGNTAAEAGIYDVTDAEGNAIIMISTAEQLNKLNAKNAHVMLNADIDFQGAAMTKPIELWGNSTFDGNGHKISNVVTAVQGGYATSLFRGDANRGDKVVKNLVIENLTTPAGYSFASAIWSDLQGANIEIDNVEINNATIEANGTIGGFVGFVSGSTTSVVIKNSTINNSNLIGGEADHKRGAVVGRAYGCVVECEDVVVNNVKINDVAATTSTLVGDKGYTGTVTVQ